MTAVEVVQGTFVTGRAFETSTTSFSTRPEPSSATCSPAAASAAPSTRPAGTGGGGSPAVRGRPVEEPVTRGRLPTR
jgi:hypothetical protein